MIQLRTLFTLPIALILCSLNLQGQAHKEGEALGPDDARMEWWREAKYGMFIHWGLYAIPARGEWVMNKDKIPVAEYEQLAPQFNPVEFDADKWVQVAQDAGMHYMVITSKHHDGFAMYDSDVTTYDIMDATPFKRDVIQELADACAKADLKFGVYYSHSLDWRNKGGKGAGWDPAQEGDFETYLNELSLPQISEIVTKYNPAVIWFDMPAKVTPEIARKFVKTVRDIHPEVIINSRLMYSGPRTKTLSEEQLQEMREVGVDYLTYRDREIPEEVVWRDWETCMTLNDSWGFTAHDTRWKDASTIIEMLGRVVNMDGNFLLNFGPTAEGILPAGAVESVTEAGAWLAVNGEAIYGARASDMRELKLEREPTRAPSGRMRPASYSNVWLATSRPADHSKGTPAKLYLIQYVWPGANFSVDGIEGKVTNAYFLSDAEQTPLNFSQSGTELSVQLPEEAPDPIATVICLEM